MDGGDDDREHDEVRGVPRIPAPRWAPDDLSPDAYRPALPHRGDAPDGAGHRSHQADSTEAEPGARRDADSEAEPGTQGDADAPGGRAAPGAGPAADAGPDGNPAAAEPDAGAGGGADGRRTHGVLKSLLGAWALSACSGEETEAVEEHLGECAPCAEEALRLREAVGLLHTDRDLDLDPLLRFQVLENCLGRRPARIPVPAWADAYDAETARLDALLRDIGESEWHAPVRLRWFEGERQVNRRTTVAGVIAHLMSVDGLVSAALGLDDPLGPAAPGLPAERTESFWGAADRPPTRRIREPWRDQSHTLIRTVSFAGRGASDLTVSYGSFALPMRDALLDRAFECWIHADDIADAVDYPYEPPSGAHLHRMIDLAARLLPAALADRRRAGLAGPARHLVTPGSPGRSLHLEVEGSGGGNWYIALDSPAAVGSADHAVAQVALDGVEFCRLVAGHVAPQDAAAGQDGDRDAIADVLFAAAALSRL
ncbi:maleylpyruvate isomerase N-terminal domain-containing protein [Streptomyces zhihengii]|uniref:Maleylpyruvate isomerase N-terminal domain-containing protein n=1 Tax=Streptomyces zhihengii TaxID=1818004 RepID=A0ABS2UTV4_9ACTN|nr:maleylpyruvate isomerase N-terminal domain-containing protein [Streptomyces zhihengii]